MSETKAKRRFLLTAGIHIGTDGREYKTGEVVETTLDLATRFGEKFRELPAGESPPPPATATTSSPQDSLDGMTVKELIKEAEAGGVELGGEKSKEGIIRLIRAAYAE